MNERVTEPNYNSRYGLKQSHAVTSMPHGSLVDVLNMNLNGRGGKSKRNGYTKLFALPTQNKVYSLIDFRRSDGTSEVIAYANTVLYSWDGSSVSSVITGLTADSEFRFQVYQDRLLGVNGVDDNFTYDGTTYTQIGIDAPTAHCTATVAAGGSLPAGTYSYVVTFYDSARGAESNPYDITTAPSAISDGAGNQTINLSTLPTVAAGQTATHHRIYRKEPAGSLFYRTAEIAYSGGGTYADTGDTAGTIEVERDTGQIDVGNTEPPNSKLIIEYNDRIFMVDESDPSTLVYSQVGKPHAFPTANYHLVGDNDGGRINKLEKHGPYLIIHKKNSIYLLYGNAASVSVSRIGKRGTHNFGTSISDVDDYLIRLTNDGIYLMMPTEYNNRDLTEYYVGRDVQHEESLIDWNDTSSVKMFNYSKQESQHVYLIIPNSVSYITKILVFDYSLGSSADGTFGEWVKYEIGTDIYSVADYESNGEKFMIFGDSYGYIWKWNDGDSDGYDLESDELNGTATAGGATTLTDSGQSWTINELVGATVYILDGTGKNQRRRIISNTATQLTIDAAWSTNPDTSSEYTVGGINAYAEEFWNPNDYQNRWKRMRWIVPYIRQTGTDNIDVTFRKDFQTGTSATTLRISVDSSDSLWGSMLWGSGQWGSSSSTLERLRFSGKYHYFSIKYQNKYAAQQFYWDGYNTVFQILSDRNK